MNNFSDSLSTLDDESASAGLSSSDEDDSMEATAAGFTSPIISWHTYNLL